MSGVGGGDPVSLSGPGIDLVLLLWRCWSFLTPWLWGFKRTKIIL